MFKERNREVMDQQAAVVGVISPSPAGDKLASGVAELVTAEEPFSAEEERAVLSFIFPAYDDKTQTYLLFL